MKFRKGDRVTLIKESSFSANAKLGEYATILENSSAPWMEFDRNVGSLHKNLGGKKGYTVCVSEDDLELISLTKESMDKFKVGDRVRSTYEGTDGQEGIIVEKSHGSNWIVSGIFGGARETGNLIQAEHYLTLVESNNNKPMKYKVGNRLRNSESGKIITITGIRDHEYCYTLEGNNHCREVHLNKYYTLLTKDNKIKTTMKKLTSMMRKAFSPELQKLYKAGFINGDVEITEEGRSELWTLVFDAHYKELVVLAQEKLKEEKNSK